MCQDTEILPFKLSSLSCVHTYLNFASWFPTSELHYIPLKCPFSYTPPHGHWLKPASSLRRAQSAPALAGFPSPLKPCWAASPSHVADSMSLLLQAQPVRSMSPTLFRAVSDLVPEALHVAPRKLLTLEKPHFYFIMSSQEPA